MNRKWFNLDVKDKFQLLTATGLIASGVVLGFVSFFLTLTVGYGVLGYITLAFSSGLGLYGISLSVKNKLGDLQAQVDSWKNNTVTREDDEIRKIVTEELDRRNGVTAEKDIQGE